MPAKNDLRSNLKICKIDFICSRQAHARRLQHQIEPKLPVVYLYTDGAAHHSVVNLLCRNFPSTIHIRFDVAFVC